jgi:putative two-component system response regulator
VPEGTILIVDDEPANLAVLSALLGPDHTVRACKSGELALAACTRDPRPDLILLDVMMPGMDGWEVLARLKVDPETRDIPVIFVTALDEDAQEERGLELGAVDYIAKPVSPPIVQARVRAHLEIKRARDRLKEQNEWLEAEVARRVSENLLVQDLSLGLMAELAETRDADTGNHIQRTQAYVGALARRMARDPRYAAELGPEGISCIVKASPLHDIGKIAIPDSILLKPGKLTAPEWEVMKTHARVGGNVIRRAIFKTFSLAGAQYGAAKPESLAFLEAAKVIAETHHEKWDGSGYPDGLAGMDIPLPGRLMALADVYDALTTPRVYKAAWTTEDAAAAIREGRGSHFDPDLVDAFDAVRDSFESIHRTLADGGTPDEVPS